MSTFPKATEADDLKAGWTCDNTTLGIVADEADMSFVADAEAVILALSRMGYLTIGDVATCGHCGRSIEDERGVAWGVEGKDGTRVCHDCMALEED